MVKFRVITDSSCGISQEEAKKLGVVVFIPVVEGQHDRVFDFVDAVQILEGDGGKAPFLHRLKLRFQPGRGDEKLRHAPDRVADRVVHQNRHAHSFGDHGCPHDARIVARVCFGIVKLGKTEPQQKLRRRIPRLSFRLNGRGQPDRLAV